MQAILGIEQAKKFSYPKSIHTVKQIIDAQIGTEKNAITLDYFGGSGTTAHAVINLNREDGGTGSGKTLLMHVNILQYLEYSDKKLDKIIVLTPREGLSRQHVADLALSD